METLTKEKATLPKIKLTYDPGSLNEKPKITSPDSAYSLLFDNWDQDRIALCEEFKVIYLNRANRVLGLNPVASGSTTGVIVDLKYIFSAAILSNSSSLILCHNHPSGNMQPSQQDKRLTSRIKKVCELLDLNLIDHIIVCPQKGNYYSFSEQGTL